MFLISLSPLLSPPTPISLSLFYSLFAIHLLSSPFFSAHPNRSRHIDSGSARGFSQLMREFFLSTVAKVLLIVATVGFLFKLKVSTLLCHDLGLKWDWTEYLLLQSNLILPWTFRVKHFVTSFRLVIYK